MNRLINSKNTKIILVSAVVFILIVVIACRSAYNSDSAKMDRYYKKLCNRECLTRSELAELYSMKSDGNADARVLYDIAEFYMQEEDVLDIIFEEKIVEGVSYIEIIARCDYYLQKNCNGKYKELNDELYSHIMGLIEKNPGGVSFDNEKRNAVNMLPEYGMKTIYFDNCALGLPDTEETDVVNGRTFVIYNWHAYGQQIYYARTCYGYVVEVYDYRSKLNKTSDSSDTGSKKKNQSSGNSGSSGKKSSHSSYDDGYDEVYDNEDYDSDRYKSDSDYADGVDDAMEDWNEEYGEDW